MRCVDKSNQIYTDKMLIDLILKYKEEFGKLPTKDDLRKNPDYPSPTTYRTRFGSWAKSLELADETYSKYKYTDEELLDILINFDGELTQPKFRKTNNPSPNTYAQRFGSWSNAIILSKIRKVALQKTKSKKNSKNKNKFNNTPRKYDKETLIEILHIYYEIEGKKPTQADLLKKQHLYPSPNTYYYRFGSWSNALKAANFDSIKLSYTDENLIKMLREFEGKPSITKINKHPDYPHSWTYANRFGSWNNAMELAGYTPNKKC